MRLEDRDEHPRPACLSSCASRAAGYALLSLAPWMLCTACTRLSARSTAPNESQQEVGTGVAADMGEEVRSRQDLSAPAAGATWYWQLSGDIDSSLDVEVYDVDLFDAPQAVIDALQKRGIIVVCYFSAGTHESWREDAAAFSAQDVGLALPDWGGERWLDVRSTAVRERMRERLDVAVARDCDGVEPDNVDAYMHDTGFELSRDDQLAYGAFLSHEAHARGLNIGLKNSPELARELEPSFDWALSEECVSRDECGEFSVFVAAGKAVFIAEYVESTSEAGPLLDASCDAVASAGYSLIVKKRELDAEHHDCSAN